MLTLVKGALSIPLLMSMSEAFPIPFLTLIKLYYTKALSDQASSMARIEVFSGGQESQCLSWFSNNLSTSWQTEGVEVETVTDFTFLSSKITEDSDCSHEIKERLASGKKNSDKPRQHIKKQRYHFVGKGPYSQSYGFSNNHVQM